MLEQGGALSDGHRHHPATIDGNRLQQSFHADERDAECGQQQDETVQKGRDDAGSMVAEGPALGSRPCGKEMGIEGQEKRPLIDEVVARVAHEADTVEEPASDKLSPDDYRVEGQGQAEP